MTYSKKPVVTLSKDIYAQLSQVHPRLPDLTDSYRMSNIPRRGFLIGASLLGLSAAGIYGLVRLIEKDPTIGHVPPTVVPEQSGGRLRISMNVKEIPNPATFDWTEKGNLGRPVLENLARVGSDNITRPYLLERWEPSEDLKTWTLHLRKGVTWHNGDMFNADDVIYNFTTWLDPATGSSNISRFSAMTETVNGTTRMIPGAIEKIDDHTVRLNLRVPDIAIPQSLGDYPTLIAHRHFLDEGGNFMDNPIGTGPFELVDLKIGERAEYRRRSTPYWGGDVPLDGVVIIDHGDDPNAWLNALFSGQVDLLYRLNLEHVPIVRQRQEDLVLYETITGQTGVIRMKIDQPPFGNKNLRRAISACVDHEQLLQIGYQDLGIIAENHHVSPIHPEYYQLPKLTQDYDLARRLLNEAGYPNGLDLTITCVTQPTWESNTCQIFAEQLKPANINVNINVMPGSAYWEQWKSAPLGFTAWTHRPLGLQVLNLAYRTGVPWNETSYANPVFDQLLDEAGSLVDVDERRQVMARVEKVLQDDAIIIQPFWRSVFTASNRKVQNFNIHPAEEIHLSKIWLS
jgi:peptide/nickel transport system substrate-binding protein